MCLANKKFNISPIKNGFLFWGCCTNLSSTNVFAARPDKTTPKLAEKGVPKFGYQAEPKHPVQTCLPSRLDMLEQAGTPKGGFGEVGYIACNDCLLK